MKKNEDLQDYAEYHDRLRYLLLQRTCWVIILILTIVTIINIPTRNYDHAPEIAGILLSALALFLLSYKKNYKAIAIFLALGGTAIINSTYFFNENDLQFAIPLYMIMTILFTFYVLNRIWGLIVLGLNFSFIVLFVFTRLETIIQQPPEFTDQLALAISVEVAACGIGIGYLINLFIISNEAARQDLVEKNKLLNVQFDVISRQNDDKTLMLKEIHHRVKNNLQIISSLIRLQAVNQGKSTEEYKDIIGRINAMALIHEKLYQSDMLTNFSLQSYLRSLSDTIMDNYSIDKTVKVDMNIRINQLSNRTVIPIALMFNELLSNSAKYAFEDVEKPLISISMRRLDGLSFEIKYMDNGQWQEETGTGFGLELIDTMTRQLDGTFSLDKSENCTAYTFTLNEIKD